VHGIPTRLVTGFVPGDYNPFTGLWEVKGKHAHAWVEAWMPGVGWVTFDATPASWLPDFGADEKVPGATMLQAVIKYVTPFVKRWAGVLALGALALAALGLFRRAMARRRDPAGPATHAYRRLRRRLAARGVPDRPADAPREWLAGAAGVPEVAPALPELTAFVARYEAVRFGGEGAEADLARLAREAEAAVGRARV
jgi:hypothetical protein